MTHPIRPRDLKPRAVAVLVALRQGPLTTLQLKRAIADDNAEDTHELLCDMITDTIDHVRGDARWYLTHEGLGWLQRNGLDADDSARLWVAQGACIVTDLNPQPKAWPQCSECKTAYVLRRAILFKTSGQTMEVGDQWVWQRDCKHRKAKPEIRQGAEPCCHLADSDEPGDNLNAEPCNACGRYYVDG